MNRETRPNISIAIPAYNIEGCVDALHERIVKTLSNTTYSYEIVFVDDASIDQTRSKIIQLMKRDPCVRGYAHIENFGQHSTISSAFSNTRGEIVVLMDGDLEHAPEDIPRFISALEDGFELVIGARTTRKETLFRRVTGNLFRRLMPIYKNFPHGRDFTTYSAIRRGLLKDFLGRNERNALYLATLDKLTPNFHILEHEPLKRFHGRSAYRLKSLMKLAITAYLLNRARFIESLNLLFLISSLTLSVAAIFASGWTSLIPLEILLILWFSAFISTFTAMVYASLLSQTKRELAFKLSVSPRAYELSKSLPAESIIAPTSSLSSRSHR